MKKVLIFLALFLVVFFSCSNPAANNGTKSEAVSQNPNGGLNDDSADADSSSDENDSSKVVKKKWTILVYMDGDNDLSEFCNGDLKEMKSAGSTADFNVLVLWDDISIHHGYYYISRNRATLKKNTGEINMGDPKTAINFIDYAASKYPAEKYIWIFWNHGGAVDRSLNMPERGVCWDQTNGNDHLSEIEQKQVFEYFSKKIAKKIDIVGFDACLMATAELLYQYKNYTQYIAASEQTIAGEGWDYKFLNELVKNPNLSTEETAKSILIYYKIFYQDESDVTFSISDLGKIEELKRTLNEFCVSAKASGTSGETFRKLAPKEDFTGYTKDLYVYMQNLTGSSLIPAAIKTKSKAVMEIISKKLMLNEWHGSLWNKKAFGVSITLKNDTGIYSELDLCKDTEWDEFLTFAGF
jgi:hypothetical protein